MKFIKNYFKKKEEKRLNIEKKREEFIRIQPLVKKLEDTKIPAYCNCESPYLYYVKSEYKTYEKYEEKTHWRETSIFSTIVSKDIVYYNCNNCNKKYKYDKIMEKRYDLQSGKIIYSNEEIAKIEREKFLMEKHRKMRDIIEASKSNSIDENIELFSKLEKIPASEIYDIRIYTEPYHFLPIEYSIEVEKERKNLKYYISRPQRLKKDMYDYIRDLENLKKSSASNELDMIKREMSIYNLHKEFLEGYSFVFYQEYYKMLREDIMEKWKYPYSPGDIAKFKKTGRYE